MNTIYFNDGVRLYTDGSFKIIRLEEGYYLVGHGMAIPVDYAIEGYELIRDLKQKQSAKQSDCCG